MALRDSFSSWINGGAAPDYDYQDAEPVEAQQGDYYYDDPAPKPPKRRSRGVEETNIVNFNNVPVQIVTRRPTRMADMAEIREYLKSHITVVVNLEDADPKTAQRMVDYLCGVSDALDGSRQCVSSRIFVCAPKNVEISGEPARDYGDDDLSYSSYEDM